MIDLNILKISLLISALLPTITYSSEFHSINGLHVELYGMEKGYLSNVVLSQNWKVDTLKDTTFHVNDIYGNNIQVNGKHLRYRIIPIVQFKSGHLPDTIFANQLTGKRLAQNGSMSFYDSGNKTQLIVIDSLESKVAFFGIDTERYIQSKEDKDLINNIHIEMFEKMDDIISRNEGLFNSSSISYVIDQAKLTTIANNHFQHYTNKVNYSIYYVLIGIASALVIIQIIRKRKD